MNDTTCDLCGHAWALHAPEDGKCGVRDWSMPEGLCPCGRNMGWMQFRLRENARRVAEAHVIRFPESPIAAAEAALERERERTEDLEAERRRGLL